MVVDALKDLSIQDPQLGGNIQFQPVRWDPPGAKTPMEATRPAQDSVNFHCKPSECDIVVAILWSRLGEICEHPDYRKPDGRYMTGTEWEILNAANNKRGDRPHLLLYKSTRPSNPDPTTEDTVESVEAKAQEWVRRRKNLQQFLDDWKRNHAAEPTPYGQPAEFAQLVKENLQVLGKQLLDESALPDATAEALAPAPPQDPWRGPPYVGLDAFSPEQSRIFFGRRLQIQQILKKVLDPKHRFGIVEGASGSGKSSLVLAGVVPLLPSEWWWCRVRLTDCGGRGDPDPMLSLAEALCPLLSGGGWTKEALADDLEAGGEARSNLIAALLAKVSTQGELLVYLDQFEELFTQVRKTRQEAFHALLDSLGRTARVRILASMRDEFSPELSGRPVLAGLLSAGFRYPLGTPSLGDLYEMARGPARLAGLEVSQELALHLVRDTQAMESPLPIFELTLTTLWEQNPGAPIDLSAYRAIGGIAGVVRGRADEALKRMRLSEERVAEELLDPLFPHLVEVGESGPPTRKRARLKDLARDESLEQRVRALCDQRLLTTWGDIVEVAHESLFAAWPALEKWVEARRAAFREWHHMAYSARVWHEKGRPVDLLWRQERLEEFLEATAELGLQPARGIQSHFLISEWCRKWKRLQDPRASHRERADYGDRLAEIGDTRPGIGLHPDGTPRIAWCPVPPGTVDLENEAGTFTVSEPFRIAKYPITHLQYRAFVKQGYGQANADWWTGLHREDEAAIQYRPIANYPADNVSWFDAMAFCGWLSARLAARGELADDKVIRLPTEWEWQQAATRGKPTRKYPWGDWQEGYANTSESKLSRTTAVGMYPHGTWPGGPLDMAGNVFEWCLNQYQKPSDTSVATEGSRVLRGGCWEGGRVQMRCVNRDGGRPDCRSNDVGFRVVCASPTN
jgi:formylglycine-generating enzyme required for sulfatase activity